MDRGPSSVLISVLILGVQQRDRRPRSSASPTSSRPALPRWDAYVEDAAERGHPTSEGERNPALFFWPEPHCPSPSCPQLIDTGSSVTSFTDGDQEGLG